MTGMAAIALCAAFTSCSKNENLYDPSAVDAMEESKIIESYNQAFIQTFGQPAANQDWGFGSVAGTRALSDMESGANKNRNLWAATDGNFKLLVPTPLTSGQKNRVRAYFQAHRYLTWQTPNMTNYFVQQVYTGGTNTAGSLSSEEYAKGNGTPVVGGQHMDKLTVTENNIHVLDFNAANNVNTATDVKNNGTLTNDTQYHSDQITLMIGTRPTCVGYHTSEGSVQHNDCMALAGAKAIDDWARAQNPVIGEDVWYGTDEEGYENSFWNRSFVGLDYEQTPIEQIYATRNNEEYAKVLDFCSDMNNTKWVLKNGQFVSLSTIQNDYILDPAGNKVHWISDNTNDYLGTNLGTTQNTFNKQGTINGVNDVKYYDLDAVYSYINQGALPKVNNMEFIKNLGGRDYIYSDWIVTLAPAQEYTPPTPPSNDYDVRIIAEDLNAKALTAEAAKDGLVDSDWDFNDVVFDVKFTSNTTADVKIVCAGGVLPLYVAGHEVHEALGRPQKDADGLYQIIGMSNAATPFEVTGINKLNNGRDIVVEVKRTLTSGKEVLFELKAEKGLPAAKIGVNPKFTPCGERQDIRTAYPLFSQWVTGNVNAWYNIPD